MPYNIWNPDRVNALLSEAADGDGRLAALLKLALRKPLLAHGAAVRALETLPPDAPGWLRDKFNWEIMGGAAFHEFDPALDPDLAPAIAHVRDWIAGAAASGADWTKEDKPRRLLHFRTVDDAVRAADGYMAEENARLKHIGVNAENEAETVMTLDNGFRVVRLLSPAALDRESAEMNHCIGHGGYDEKLRSGLYAYYSLRDAADRPHATMEIETKTDVLRQCKGKQNVPPVEIYFPFIRAFVEREKLVLRENPGHTGLWQAPDGAYHSVRRLPPGARIEDSLDVSTLTDVVLPACLQVTGTLAVDGACPPAMPEKMNVRFMKKTWRKNGNLHREDGPAYLYIDAKTGVTMYEMWKMNNKFCREGGPANIRRHPRENTIIAETWFRDDKPCRADGPAHIVRDDRTGVITEEDWFRNGGLHREGNPAFIRRNAKTGKAVREIWCRDNKMHREDGPAETIYDPKTGNVTLQRWLWNNIPHRTDGPAIVNYDPKTGKISQERWYQGGMKHRIGGPAEVNYNLKTGKAAREIWYKNGVEISPGPARPASPAYKA